MGFNASTAVEKLEWDFRPHVDADGVTPEPSTDEIAMLQIALQRFVAIGERGLVDDKAADPKTGSLTVDEALELLDPDTMGGSPEATEVIVGLLEVVEQVTHGSPTAEQILALPGRVQREYLGWLAGSLLDPKFGSNGTRPSLALVKGA